MRPAPSLSGAPSSPSICPLLPPNPLPGHHGRCHRQRLDPPEAAGAGATLGPAVCQQEAEQPQQEPRALQRQPGGYLLQSAHLRPQEAQVAAPRSVWVTVGRSTLGSPHLPICMGTLWSPLSSLGLPVSPTSPVSLRSARSARTTGTGNLLLGNLWPLKTQPCQEPASWPIPASSVLLLSLMRDGFQRKSLFTPRVLAYPGDRA